MPPERDSWINDVSRKCSVRLRIRSKWKIVENRKGTTPNEEHNLLLYEMNAALSVFLRRILASKASPTTDWQKCKLTKTNICLCTPSGAERNATGRKKNPERKRTQPDFDLVRETRRKQRRPKRKSLLILHLNRPIRSSQQEVTKKIYGEKEEEMQSQMFNP